MGRQKLTERNTVTTSLSADYIHVVQGGQSYKITKNNFLADIVSGFQGSLAIADTPSADGTYIASESGTYTNAGSLVVDLTTYLTYIVVSDSQTTFEKIEVTIPSPYLLSGGYSGTGQDIYDLNTSKATENIAFIKNILETDLRDCSIYVCSDSTGNATNEWVYRFADEYLAVQYPAYTVDYYLYDTGTQTYTLTNIQTGSGSNTVSIYNSALSGGVPQDFIGDNKQTSIIDNAPYDLMILNHGHNLKNYYTNTDDYRESIALFLEFTEEFLKINGKCGVVVFAQNPNRDDTDMDTNFEKINSLCALRGFGMVDAFTPFIDASKDSGLYSDNVHPSSTGTDLYLAALYKAWNGNPTNVVQSVSSFDTYAPDNLLPNGVFEGYDTGTPDDWTNTGCTVTKETTIVDDDSANNYSLKLVDGNIYYDLNSDMIRKYDGKVVTLAVRMFIPDGETAQTGRIAMTSSGFSVTSPPVDTGQGDWRWKIITKKLDLSTYWRVVLYGASSGSGTCYVDRVVLVEGELPKNFIKKPEIKKIVLENLETNVLTGDTLSEIVFKSNDASANGVGEAGAIRVIAENNGSQYGLAFFTKNAATETEVARFDTQGRLIGLNLRLSNLPVYADEAAAVTGGIATGEVYQTSTGELRIKL